MKTQKQRQSGVYLLVMAIVCASGMRGSAEPATDAKPSLPQAVQDHIRQRVEQNGAGGIVVGLVGEGGVTFFADGVAAKGGPKLDEDSVFEIGSITKAFTSLLLADAVNRGEVKLDDPVAKHLPPTVKVPTYGDKAITLEHLATHRSGLPRLPDNMLPRDAANPYADYTADRLYEFLNGYKLSKEPGTAYEYSNLGAGLLGHVLARVAGKSYDELLRERLCGPLGMKHTACALTTDMKAHLAQGHSGGKAVPGWDLDALAGAGAIRSTAGDMMTFLAACLGFSGDTLRPLLAKCLERRYPTVIPATDIGLGWHINKKYGDEIIWHNGGTGGYHSFCGFRPERKLGVVVLTNTSDDIDDIGMHLLAPESPLTAMRSAVAVDATTLDDYVGYYAFAPGILLHVTREDATLQAQLTGQDAFPIFAESKDKFFYKVVDAQLTFVRDEAGKVTKVILRQNGRDQAAERLAKDQEPKPRVEATVAPEILKGYVGKYQLTSEVIMDVQTDANKLTVQLTGQPRFPVFAESETKFFYKVVDAQITFVRGADGKISSLILHQGGRDQTAKRVE